MGDAGVHRYFHVEDLPLLLALRARAAPPRILVDLGAGDGTLLYALDRAGLLGDEAVAVDLSAERVALAETVSPVVRGLVADATAVPLADGTADAVVLSQLIEHVPDERKLVDEAARLLRPGGWLYASSVIRGRRAWWIYRAQGRWQVDPTHVREYPSEDAFAAALEHPDLVREELRSEPLRFPALDLAARAAALVRLTRFERLPTLYRDHPRLTAARRVRVPVPGYRWVEAVSVKRA